MGGLVRREEFNNNNTATTVRYVKSKQINSVAGCRVHLARARRARNSGNTVAWGGGPVACTRGTNIQSI